MDKLVVAGGRPLHGAVDIGGAKNSALKLLAAALLAPGRSVIENVPRIVDCRTMTEVVEHLGANVRWDGHTVEIDAAPVDSQDAPYELVSRMRASIIVLGPLLARFGRARVAMPGGCNIGSRRIDLHLRGLERMGISFEQEHGYLEATGRLQGAVVSLGFPSVGATENLLMAAVAAHGTSVIDNAAREPEIGDLADMLTGMGARIEGAGTHTIEVEGVDGFRPVRHAVVPDRVEAGTFAIATVAAGGDVLLNGARAEHLELPLSKLAEAGAVITDEGDGVRVRMDGRPEALDPVVTLPYPGFATDLQPQMLAMLATAQGTSIVAENVFEGRFMFVEELERMGADILTRGNHAVIRGVDRLSAAPVRALDIRAGAAMVIAGLTADGVTEISDVHFIDRGYEGLEDKLTGLGAEVRRESERSPAFA
ncbi:MAG TPA: UDP-N-acetylglucosamine 1-carboxyvinyltransferase [Actinomycetota bacterium]|nr:UDP-N-acetylglucosamine 1-carboxyvinyltransferase [Actinomycetota bacterium]